MLLEISCVIGLFWFAVSLIKEKDLSYVVGFVFGFLIGLWVESYGILTNVWEYQNIASPFNYPIYGVPVGIVLLYASITSLAVFLNKFFAGAREKHKDKLDKYVGYISTITGVALFLLSQAFGIHYFIGLSFIMIGLYMFVKTPLMFYVGVAALTADFIFERFLVLNNQIIYAASYGDISVGFFLGGAIFSALFILIGRRLSFSKNARK